VSRELHTIADLQQLPLNEQRHHVGDTVEHLHALAMREDGREVAADEASKYTSNEHRFDWECEQTEHELLRRLLGGINDLLKEPQLVQM
jgi:hypothetical protein